MQDIILAFAAITGLSAAGCIVVAALWLRKFRQTMSVALAETSNQQLKTSQRLNDVIAYMQKQQRSYEQQLQTLTQANTQLRQGLVTVATQLQHGGNQVDASRSEPTIH